jgi:U3 small nucleolar RNA-associated protein 20
MNPRYTSAHFDTSTQETILFWSEIISTDVIGSNNAGSLASSFTAKGLLRFPSAKGQTSLPQGLMNIMNQSFDWEKERNALNTTDMDADDCNISAITILASILHLVPVIEIPLDKVSQILISLLGSLKDFLKKDAANNILVDAPYVLAHKNFVLECLLGLILEALAGIAEHDSNVLTQMKNIHEELINDILLVYSTNEVVLSGIYRYLDLLYSG